MKDYKKIRKITIKFIAAVEKKRNSDNLKEIKYFLMYPELTVKDIDEIAWRFCWYANQYKFGELKPATTRDGVSIEIISRKLAECWREIIAEEANKFEESYYSSY